MAFAAVPLIALGGGDYPLSLPKLTLLWWCAIVAFAGWTVSWLATRTRLPRVHLAIPVAVLVVITAFATVFSISPDRSLLGINGRYEGLLPLLTMIVIAFCVVAFTWDWPERLWSLVYAGAASGLVGALAIVVMRLGVSIGPATVTSTLSRPNGLLGNPDFSGAHVALMLPLLWILVRRVPDRWIVALWLAVLVDVIGIGLTQSRGAFLAALVGLGVLGWLQRDLVTRAVTVIASVVAVGAIGVIVLSAGLRWTGGDVPLPSSGLLSGDTLTGRIDYWIGAAAIVRDRPLLGTGPDTFALAYPPVARTMPPEVLVSSPHDIFFERAVGAGLAGLATYLVLAAFTLRTAIRFVRRRADDAGNADDVDDEDHSLVVLAAGFAAMFAAYLAQGLVSLDIVPMALLGWVAIAAIAALADPGVVRARASEPTGRAARPAVAFVGAGVVLVLALVAVVVALRPLRADRDLANAVSSAATIGALAPRADAAIALDPIETDLDNRAATADLTLTHTGTPQQQQEALADALRHVADGLDRAPGDTDLLLTKAALLRRSAELGDPGGYGASDTAYAERGQRDPRDPSGAVLWARLLDAWWKATNDPAIRDRAVAQTDRAESLLPDDWAPGWYTVALAWNDVGNRDRARRAVERALALQPDYPQARQLQQQLG